MNQNHLGKRAPEKVDRFAKVLCRLNSVRRQEESTILVIQEIVFAQPHHHNLQDNNNYKQPDRDMVWLLLFCNLLALMMVYVL